MLENNGIFVREYTDDDIDGMRAAWNEVVRDGIAFPQENELSHDEARAFFAEQTYCGVAVTKSDGVEKVLGMYILHPNNVGRCSHISNASFAVRSECRGNGVGEALVRDCVKKAGEKGFGVLQFNAVVATNTAARRLYEKVGFTQLGTIPEGFRNNDGTYSDICPYYIKLEKRGSNHDI